MNVALIFAGGIGSRMGKSQVPKQFLDYGGKPLIIYTLAHFESHPEIDGIAVAVPEDWQARFAEMCEQFQMRKVRWIVSGGDTGQSSIAKLIEAVERDVDQQTTKVLVHDGVRPLIDERIISECIATAAEGVAAITVYPAVETMVVSHDSERVEEILPRQDLFIAQAPQAFMLREIAAAHASARLRGITDYIDSCSLYRAELGGTARFVLGTRANIKVTTPEDYFMSRALLELHQFHEVEGES